MKKYLLSRYLRYLFSFRFVSGVVLFAFAQIWTVTMFRMDYSYKTIAVLSILLPSALAVSYHVYLYHYQYGTSMKRLNELKDALTNVDYWYAYLGSAVGVNVAEKKLHIITEKGNQQTVNINKVLGLESTICLPELQHSKTLHVSSSGSVDVTRSMSNSFNDSVENDRRIDRALKSTGLIFSLDVLTTPSIFIHMREEDIGFWFRLVQHLSEDRLESQPSPMYFPESYRHF